MTAQTTSTDNAILRQQVLGSRRFSNYWWATVVSGGAGGFLLAGLSSYLQVNLLPFTNPTELMFVPQGLVMSLYGIAGLLLALYLWLTILWDLGGGYNEFNRQTSRAIIFRWGYPGKNRRIEISCPLEDVQGIIVKLKEGLNPRRAIYLRVKGKANIPLTRVGQPLALSELENQAADWLVFWKYRLKVFKAIYFHP